MSDKKTKSFLALDKWECSILVNKMEPGPLCCWDAVWISFLQFELLKWRIKLKFFNTTDKWICKLLFYWWRDEKGNGFFRRAFWAHVSVFPGAGRNFSHRDWLTYRFVDLEVKVWRLYGPCCSVIFLIMTSTATWKHRCLSKDAAQCWKVMTID